MEFEFGGKSALHGRILRKPINRFAYVPRTEQGFVEYILAYEDRIPAPDEEPELFSGAVVDREEGHDKYVTLKYPETQESVLLIIAEEDDAFRRDHPDIVLANEMFVIRG